MNTERSKTKWVITVVLLSLVNLIIFSVGSIMYLTPITILLMPVFYALFQGIVFFILGVKVKRKGAILLYCVIQGAVAFNVPYFLMYLLAGVIAEAVMAKTGYGDVKGLTVSYILMQMLAAFGSTVYPYKIVADATLKGIEDSGDLYVQVSAASEMIDSWGLAFLLVAVLAASVIGAFFGKGVMQKHLTGQKNGWMEDSAS